MGMDAHTHSAHTTHFYPLKTVSHINGISARSVCRLTLDEIESKFAHICHYEYPLAFQVRRIPISHSECQCVYTYTHPYSTVHACEYEYTERNVNSILTKRIVH